MMATAAKEEEADNTGAQAGPRAGQAGRTTRSAARRRSPASRGNPSKKAVKKVGASRKKVEKVSQHYELKRAIVEVLFSVVIGARPMSRTERAI